MWVYRVDAERFKYLTKASGHTLQEVADLLGCSLQSLYLRLKGVIPFRAPEISKWANFVGCTDVLPVFYVMEEIG